MRTARARSQVFPLHDARQRHLNFELDHALLWVRFALIDILVKFYAKHISKTKKCKNKNVTVRTKVAQYQAFKTVLT